MKNLMIVFGMLLYLLQTLDAGELVSPKERMLQRNLYTILSLSTRAQMMMKDYALTVLGVRYANPEANLEDEIEEQNDEFQMLDLGQIDPALKAEEEELRKRWITISKLFVHQKRSPDRAAKLLEKIDAFDKKAIDLADKLARHSIHPALIYAFDLQRLNRLTQRISTLYEMRTLQVLDEEQTHQRIAEMLDQIKKITKRLRQAPDSLFSKKLKEELRATDRNLSLYKIMALSRSQHYIPALISQKSNEMDMLLRNIVEEHQVVVQHMPDGLLSGRAFDL
ncbi:hypothetical protein [Nitratifractor sp.]